MEDLLDVLFAVARGNDPGAEIAKLSIRTYRDNMTAPHRMDLMVSAMTNSCGEWQCNQKCVFCYAAGQVMGETAEMTTQQLGMNVFLLTDCLFNKAGAEISKYPNDGFPE